MRKIITKDETKNLKQIWIIKTWLSEKKIIKFYIKD